LVEPTKKNIMILHCFFYYYCLKNCKCGYEKV
jgi:hypothetical protein